jgi:hypothetical protein
MSAFAPVAREAAVVPAATPTTVSVSPLSGSVSAPVAMVSFAPVTTLKLGLVPGMALLTPPASVALTASACAVGASSAPWMVTVMAALLCRPPVSWIV